MVHFDSYVHKLLLHRAAEVCHVLPVTRMLFSNSGFAKTLNSWIPLLLIMPSGTHTYVCKLYFDKSVGAVSIVATTTQDDKDLKDSKLRKTKSTVRLRKRKTAPPKRSKTVLADKGAKLPLIVQLQTVEERAITPQVFKIAPYNPLHCLCSSTT